MIRIMKCDSWDGTTSLTQARWSGGADREHRPHAKADPVAVAQRDRYSRGNLPAVHLRSVGGTLIQEQPGAVLLSDQHGVQVRDARIGGRAAQVDLRRDAAGHAAPSDPHLGS